jgi:c-di-GMP-binding flagellar brake protein YcgR
VADGRGSSSEERGVDLVWRVRVLSLSESEIVVEQPSAAGTWIDLQSGVNLVAGMSIGQNRWMFHTRVLGPGARHPRALRLAMPDNVERCQRRNFLRISTAELSLPLVECWPLLDPTTVIAAEVANRDQFEGHPASGPVSNEPMLLPEVGPRFTARLMNFGGGGAGLIVAPGDSAAVDRARLYWIRIHLMPHLPAPLGITARLVHTHIDSTQSVYAGLAFEWSFNPAHKDFVIEQVSRCSKSMQAAQASRKRAA